ncbi:MAG: hypothetical protein DWQ56_25420 [Microcystis aeruginosa DA14]|uniref:Uncharacterized protein n=1 Tax=Microcystis aeruginosa DA14 TaxID=1987506 RepID=A0A3E0LTX7_MICAE|nr:MAG: hypothetical protein DWQ56_25420 [Microcystis aeruginosa DA14]
MARDKLITIRIEEEKREAFKELAKSQNTDTASLLYDFISQCLDGKIDIKLVTGKGNRLDKLDNQLDTNRLDKLETATQRLDERLGQISKKLTDWIEAFGDRLNDCDRELSEKITSLEHRLNALSIQLDSQRIDSEIDRIDTDSQRIDDMEPLLKRERESPIASIDGTVETVSTDSSIETVTDAIGPVGMNAADAAKYLKTKKVRVSYASLHRWRDGVSIPNTSPQGRDARKHLILRNKLYYPIN